mmetsp:Transcript_4387/g.7466  ORF Transcript_4387/g.7466 Transcript_4387/m.7466 type:complete len:230 (+) Transcript_4387:508-1197(+)
MLCCCLLLRTFWPRTTAWILTAAASCSCSSSFKRFSSTTASAFACSEGSVRVRIFRISTMDEHINSSDFAAHDFSAIVSDSNCDLRRWGSDCSSWMSSRRFCLPSNILFCTARPRMSRWMRTIAARREAASRSCSSTTASGRSGPLARRLRATSLSLSSSGAGQHSPCPRWFSLSVFEWTSTFSMLATCFEIRASSRSVAPLGRPFSGRCVLAFVIAAGMLISSSTVSR